MGDCTNIIDSGQPETGSAGANTERLSGHGDQAQAQSFSGVRMMLNGRWSWQGR